MCASWKVPRTRKQMVYTVSLAKLMGNNPRAAHPTYIPGLQNCASHYMQGVRSHSILLPDVKSSFIWSGTNQGWAPSPKDRAQ